MYTNIVGFFLFLFWASSNLYSGEHHHSICLCFQFTSFVLLDGFFFSRMNIYKMILLFSVKF